MNFVSNGYIIYQTFLRKNLLYLTEQMHEALWYNNDLNREDQDSSGSGFMGDREFGDSSSIQMDFDRVFDDMDQFSSESGFLEEKEDAVAWI